MKQNILIIEENLAVRFLLSTVLKEDFMVYDAVNCYQAMPLLQKNRIDLIILNAGTPHSQNMDCLIHLKSSSLFSEIPVIITTDNKTESFRKSSLECGAEAVFTKPFDPVKLLECAIGVLSAPEELVRMFNRDEKKLKPENQFTRFRRKYSL
jgi:DNA-binding response OmpR family regulator